MIAKKGAKKGEKRPRIPQATIKAARQMLANTTKSPKQVAKELKISLGTLYYQTGGKKRVLQIKADIMAEKAASVMSEGAKARVAKQKAQKAAAAQRVAA